MPTAMLGVPASRLDPLNSMLTRGVQVPDVGAAQVIDAVTVDFGDGVEADIKVVNSESGPYVDAVLFDDGHEVMALDPAATRVDGTFVFHPTGWAESYTADITRA